MTKAITCGRCGAENPADATYCDGCQFPLKFRPAILKDNCWEAAPDELAVFFRVGQLQGLFSKAVIVPAGMRALIVQDGKTEEVGHGTHPVDSMLARLNRFFRDKHADILITRQNAVAVEFSFDDIYSAEFLKVGVTASLNVRIGDATSFAQHFMSAPGCVTVTNVRDLLKGAVRQALADFIGTLSLREMVGKPDLREQLSMRLHGALKERFAGFGLLVDGVDSVSLRHDKFMENRELEGTLWLVADEQKVRIAHQRDLDQLYSEDEWRKIKREEEDVRLRYRRSELSQEEAELAHVIRLREIELYERVTEADTREKAIQLGAADAVAQLEAEYFKKSGDKNQQGAQWQHEWSAQGRTREDEVAHWDHLRGLAALKQKTEFQLENARAQSSVEVEKLQLENDIEKIRIGNDIEQSRLIENEEVRRETEARLRQNVGRADQRDQELHDVRHQSARQEIELGTFARKREANRIHEYEEAAAESKIEDIKRQSKGKDTSQKLQDLEGVMALQAKKNQLEFEQKDRESEAEWQREVAKQKLSTDAQVQKTKLDLDRIAAIGNLSIAAQIAVSEGGANVAALTELAKLEAFKGMSEDQIMAISLQHSPHAADVLKAKYAQTTSGQDVAMAEKRMLEAMLADKDKQAAEKDRLAREIMDRNDAMMSKFSDFGGNAMQKMMEAAVGVAHGGHGSASAPAAPSQAPAVAPVVLHLKICPSCGTENIEGARFCHKCGKNL